MKATKAYIFDMDGVLFLSSDIHRQAFAKTLAERDVELPDYAEIAGMRTDAAFDHIFRRAGIALRDAERQALVTAKRNLALRLLEAERPVSPQCQQVLAALRDKGYLLALASSASAQSVDLFLKVSGTENCFSAVLSGDSVSSAKPHPEIYLTGARMLGLSTRDCIVVEDSKSGVIAGRRAGAKVIGVAGETSQRELMESGADRVIASIGELINVEPAAQ